MIPVMGHPPCAPSPRCPDCGIALGAGLHECNPDNIMEYQGALLAKEIPAYFDSSSGQHHEEFAVWCREHGR